MMVEDGFTYFWTVHDGTHFFLSMKIIVELVVLDKSSKVSLNFYVNILYSNKCYKFIMHYANTWPDKTSVENVCIKIVCLG